MHEWLRSSEASGTAGPFGSLSVTRTADPRAGDTFLIIDKSQNRALAGRDGQAILEDVGGLGPEEPVPRNWQWLCTERDGFKGFQNVATRGFLGHDIWWNFEAKVPHHKWWECVVLSRHEGGYYWIQFLDGWVLWQFSAKPDGRGVFAQRDGGTL